MKQKLDPNAFTVVAKSGSNKSLDANQLAELRKVVATQGDLASLDPHVREQLRGYRMHYLNDPELRGSAAIIDFSVRAVSIHKTWSVFKKLGDIIQPDLEMETGVSLGQIFG